MTQARGRSPSDKRILFVYDRILLSYIERDWQIIADAYPNSQLFRWRGVRDVWRLGAALLRSDLILCWFGGRHAWWAAMLNQGRSPLVVVAGGWDVARMPEIPFGAHAMFPQRLFARALFRRATRVLAVSAFTARCAEEIARVPRERIGVIHHGFDPERWPLGTAPRPLDVVTLMGYEWPVKGIDVLLEAAALVPDVQFEILQRMRPPDRDRLERQKPANVTFLDPLYGDAQRAKLAAAKVYLQPSRHESFGCAVAEAMLSGCVPVVTRTSALPEVVGDAGIYIENLSPTRVAAAVQKALAAPERARTVARERIVNHFEIDAYAAKLRAELAALLG
jgi:glycosyltransferase involved in cell wall biosynthesis